MQKREATNGQWGLNYENKQYENLNHVRTKDAFLES